MQIQMLLIDVADDEGQAGGGGQEGATALEARMWGDLDWISSDGNSPSHQSLNHLWLNPHPPALSMTTNPSSSSTGNPPVGTTIQGTGTAAGGARGQSDGGGGRDGVGGRGCGKAEEEEKGREMMQATLLRLRGLQASLLVLSLSLPPSLSLLVLSLSLPPSLSLLVLSLSLPLFLFLSFCAGLPPGCPFSCALCCGGVVYFRVCARGRVRECVCQCCAFVCAGVCGSVVMYFSVCACVGYSEYVNVVHLCVRA